MLEEEEGKKKLYLLHWSLKGQARDNSWVTVSERKGAFQPPVQQALSKGVKAWENVELDAAQTIPSTLVDSQKQNKTNQGIQESYESFRV